METITTAQELRKSKAIHIKNMCVASASTKARDIECWNMYNEFQDEHEFDYLRKIGDNELPARIRNVGKQRSKINNLVSRQSRRPFTFSISAVDDHSLSKKRDDMLRQWISLIDDKVKERYYNVTLQIQQIDSQMQKLQQSVQQASQQEGADPAAVAQMQEMLPIYTMQFQTIKDKLDREKLFTEVELKENERFLKYSFHDLTEQLAQKLGKKLYTRLEAKNKGVKNFIAQCVTGKQYYYVDYIPGERLPRFATVNGIKVYFPSVEGIAFIENGEWVAIEENWDLSQVMKLYKHKMSADDIKGLNESQEFRGNNANIIVTPDHGAIFSDGVYAGTLENSNSRVVKVLRLWWKEERQIQIKKSPNVRTGDYFRHFLTKGKTVLYSADYAFKNGKYVHKKTKESIPAAEVEFVNLDKGEFVTDKCVFDRYSSVVLNDKICIDNGLDKVQPRSIDDLSDVLLPVVGKTYSTITDRPYSLLWSTRDLQKLYKIVHYHRELLLAISGTRGNVIDVSQKPTDMSMKQWEYHKKMGRLYIQTLDKNGRKLNNSYNQWQAFDDTVTNSIQYLDNILRSLDEEIGDTMGMPRQAMGTTVASDQVGTFEMSQQAALLTTEILFFDNDIIEARALTQFFNLAAEYCFSEDELIEVTDNNLGREITHIPKGLLKGKQWEFNVANNIQDEQRLNQLKQLAIKQNDKGQLAFGQLLDLFDEDSTMALRKKFEYFSEKAAEIQQMSSGQAKQDQIDIDQAKIKFQAEYDQLAAQQQSQIEGAKIEIDRARMENEKNRDLMKSRNDEMKMQQDGQLRGAEIQSENNMEMAFLSNDDKHQTTNEQLQSIQIQLDALMNKANLQLQSKGQQDTHIHNMEKLKIEDKKANQKGRENVRD